MYIKDAAKVTQILTKIVFIILDLQYFTKARKVRSAALSSKYPIQFPYICDTFAGTWVMTNVKHFRLELLQTSCFNL